MMKFKVKSFLISLMVILSVLFLVFDKDEPKAFTKKQVPKIKALSEPQWDLLPVRDKHKPPLKQMFYNMVPRCGSGSMRSLLRNLSKANHFVTSKDFTMKYILANYHISKEDILATAEGLQSLKEPWIFTKHLNYINFTQYGYDIDPMYINIVRDPIDKLESHYYHRRSNLTPSPVTYWGKVVADFFKDSDEADRRQRNKMTFDECVLTSDPECTDVRFIWTIIPHFCGQHFICQTPTRNALNLAIKNVLADFAVVGYVDKFIEFLEVLEVIAPRFFNHAVDTHLYLHQQNPNYQHRREFTGPNASIAAREVLTGMVAIQLEYEFYNFIRKRFKVVYASHTGRKLS